MLRVSIFQKSYFLPFTVFLTGACVLVIEVAAVRVLSPYFGNTIFSVSSVISVILAALSLGYYVGGRLADRYPAERHFFSIILCSGVLVVAVHFLSLLFLPVLSTTLSLASGPFVSSLVLYFLPAVLLGTLSPYAITLQALRLGDVGIGTVTGTLFFWSTVGSIAGSLLAGFVLIPSIGIDMIFMGTGAVLFVLGALPLLFMTKLRTVLANTTFLFIALLTLTVTAAQSVSGEDVVYVADGVYEKLSVHDVLYEGRPARVFKQDRSTSGAIFLDSNDPTDLVYEYTKYYELYKLFNPKLDRALVIGGGVYSIPRALLEEDKNVVVDVVEIEPSLEQVAVEYFGMDPSDRINTFIEDGRRFLVQEEHGYDLIFSDVYYSLYSIPAHFTTVEFFSLAKRRLAPDGVFVANIIGTLSREEPSLALSLIRTFREVFPNSYFFASESSSSIDIQNIIMVGHNGSLGASLEERINDDPTFSAFLRGLPERRIDVNRYALDQYPLLTDNYAPVDFLTSKLLKRSRVGTSVSGEEMMALIQTQLRYGPRYMGSRGRDAVQGFISRELSALVASTTNQSWEYSARDGVTYTLKNIIGRTQPDNNRRVLLGTHYDSKRFADRSIFFSDNPVPGANDSASGVAVLLELARVLAHATSVPSVGVDFVFFDGEEGDILQQGDYTTWKPLGSEHFVAHLDSLYKKPPQLAIVIDMVCEHDVRFEKESTSYKYAPDLVESFWRVGRMIDEDTFVNAVSQPISDDHTALINAGIPSMLLIDYTYSPFHTVRDTYDKCSPRSLKITADALLQFLYMQ